LPYRYSVQEAWVNVRQDGHREKLTPRMAKWYESTPKGQSLQVGNQAIGDSNSGFNKRRMSYSEPAPSILSKANSGTRDLYHPDIAATPTIDEIKRVASFPDDFILTGAFNQQWERMGRAVPPVMMSHIARTVATEILDKCKP